MKPIRILALILCACFLSVALGQEPAGKVLANWSEFHRGNMERWNNNEKVLGVHNVGNLTLKWSYASPGNWRWSSPVVTNGIVYAGSRYKVYALDGSTGHELWASDYEVYGSPAVSNGIVYCSSGEFPGLNALDALTGAFIWHGMSSDSAPTVTANGDGVVYTTGYLNYHRQYIVSATDASTGALLWTESKESADGSSPALANGTLYLGPFALNASTGALLWEADPNLFVDPSPTVANGVVYATGQGNIYALNANTGALTWIFATGMSIAGTTPAVANGIVYIGVQGGDQSFVYALNATTGELLWRYDGPEGSLSESSPAVANGVVYIGSANYLSALNAKTGSLLWSYSNPSGGNWSSPVVVNGMLYVGSDKLYAFGLK